MEGRFYFGGVDVGHLGSGKKEVFLALARRLQENPIGAPLNETLMQILYTLFTEKEAAIGSSFPQGITNLSRLSSVTGLPETELVKHLNNMADKGLVMDFPRKSKSYYILNPLVIGFFEYTFMRVSDKLPMGELAKLFEAYHQEKGVAEEFFGGDTKIFQTLAYEDLFTGEVETEVLDYEKASQIIRDAGGGSLTMCYCRHQAAHRGVACDAPIDDICTSLGNASEWLVRRGFARPATVDELLRVLDETEKLGLVHLADNVQKNPAFICHCCGCCCGVLRSINEHKAHSVQTSNFIPVVNIDNCVGCGNCMKRCHINAISLNASDNDKKNKAVINTELCIGCGACVKGCKKNAMMLVRKKDIYIPPKDKKEQMLNIANDKGKKKRNN